ncbi:hypothetical protein BJX66DRAFT_11091 [Aspergillus keveii]|uniref:Uncharacterized protein n=1 Tax=Aspergillus keveii TaxID=714993 RepID=A0ABR4GR70_9EURO
MSDGSTRPKTGKNGHFLRSPDGAKERDRKDRDEGARSCLPIHLARWDGVWSSGSLSRPSPIGGNQPTFHFGPLPSARLHATLYSLSCRQQSPCSGVESGFCGIQHDDWHPAYPPGSNSSIVLIHAIPRAKATSIKRRRVPPPVAMGSLAWEIRLGTLHLKRWGARHQRVRGSSSDLGTQERSHQHHPDPSLGSGTVPWEAW